MNLRIVVDIDGVLANVDSYIEILNNHTGKCLKREDISWYTALWDLYGKKLANSVFQHRGVVRNMTAHQENIAELIIWLHTEKHEVSIVTSRPVEVQKATRQWLDEQGIVAFPVYHVQDKEVWAKKQLALDEKVDVWIDDSVEVCEGVDAHVGATFLVNRPWNLKSVTWVPRVANLWDVTHYMHKRAQQEQKALLATNVGIDSPQRAGDVGYDLHCRFSCSLQPGAFKRIAVGTEADALKVAIPDGYWGFIMGRSRLLEQGLIVSSTPIDSGYRGPLYTFAHNVSLHRIVIEKGERIAQLVLIESQTPPLYLADVLPASERGEQGFGSTGK